MATATCPRSRFLGSFTDHFDGLPTIRPTDLAADRADSTSDPPDRNRCGCDRL
jgi:hypothetical protein